MQISWKKYFEVRKDKGERELLKEALQYVTHRGTALDLGAGSMNDSMYLLSQDFKHVIAMDNDDDSIEFANKIQSDHFEFVKETFQNFYFQEDFYDLINAQYALPFLSPVEFSNVFSKIITALKRGGVFCGQFFGNRDSWAQEGSIMNFHTMNNIEKLCCKFKIAKIEEEEKDDVTALGKSKHWHVFHVIAVKK